MTPNDYSWNIWLTRYPKFTAELYKACQYLVEKYFNYSDEEAVEKFCKTFCESMFNLRTLEEEASEHAKVNREDLVYPRDFVEHAESIKKFEVILISKLKIFTSNYDVFLNDLQSNSIIQGRLERNSVSNKKFNV